MKCKTCGYETKPDEKVTTDGCKMMVCPKCGLWRQFEGQPSPSHSELNEWLNTKVPCAKNSKSLWPIKELLEYWKQTDHYEGDSLTLEDAVFDLRQVAEALGI